MHEIASFLYTLASYIVIISALVFIHEFGHYIIARWSGVKIEIFSIGFGREIWGFSDKTGTRWKLSSVPFGGYVKMYGDASEISNPSEEVEYFSEEQKKKTFHYKPLYKKAAIVAAGPVANFLLTIAIFTAFISTGGLISTEPVVGEIVKASAAEAAGLLPGDRIVRVDNEKVDTFNDIPRLILTNLGTPVTLDVDRGGKPMVFTLTPRNLTEKDALGNEFTHPIIGIGTKNITLEEVGIPRAIWESTKRTYRFCTTTLHVLGQILIGERSFSENIKGPIGMAKLSGQAVQKGLPTVLILMANISASLGLINLFPIPMLDGGHLLYYAIEAIRGRPLARRYQEWGLRVGMSLIAMLMMYSIINDIGKLLHSVS